MAGADAGFLPGVGASDGLVLECYWKCILNGEIFPRVRGDGRHSAHPPNPRLNGNRIGKQKAKLTKHTNSYISRHLFVLFTTPSKRNLDSDL